MVETTAVTCEPCTLAQDLAQFVKGSDATKLKNPAIRVQSWIRDAVALHLECKYENCPCRSDHDEITTEAWRTFYQKGGAASA